MAVSCFRRSEIVSSFKATDSPRRWITLADNAACGEEQELSSRELY